MCSFVRSHGSHAGARLRSRKPLCASTTRARTCQHVLFSRPRSRPLPHAATTIPTPKPKSRTPHTPPAPPPSPPLPTTTQNHSNEDIYEKAVALLEAYFDVEDGEVENLAPAVDAAQGERARRAAPPGWAFA